MTIRKSATSRRKPEANVSANIFERIEAFGRSIPAREQARHPRDGARNLHHYLYGAAKQDPT